MSFWTVWWSLKAGKALGELSNIPSPPKREVEFSAKIVGTLLAVVILTGIFIFLWAVSVPESFFVYFYRLLPTVTVFLHALGWLCLATALFLFVMLFLFCTNILSRERLERWEAKLRVKYIN